MEFWIFFAIILLVIIPVAMLAVSPVVKKHQNVSGNVVNYDPVMHKYVYRVCMSEDEIIKRMETKNVTDDLICRFDTERAVVKISEYGSTLEYYYEIIPFDGYSVLKLNQVSAIGMSSHIPYRLNPYMVEKLNAELLPFERDGE